MLFGIGARRWGRVRRQRSRRRRTRSRARGRGDFVGFISPSSVGIVRGLTVLNAVRSSHAALPKGHHRTALLAFHDTVLAKNCEDAVRVVVVDAEAEVIDAHARRGGKQGEKL